MLQKVHGIKFSRLEYAELNLVGNGQSFACWMCALLCVLLLVSLTKLEKCGKGGLGFFLMISTFMAGFYLKINALQLYGWDFLKDSYEHEIFFTIAWDLPRIILD